MFANLNAILNAKVDGFSKKLADNVSRLEDASIVHYNGLYAEFNNTMDRTKAEMHDMVNDKLKTTDGLI